MGTRTRLRGRTARGRTFNKATKALVVNELATVGATLTFDRVDVGEWNERRVWWFVTADGVRHETCEVTFKGDRPDWVGLMFDACELTGGHWADH